MIIFHTDFAGPSECVCAVWENRIFSGNGATAERLSAHLWLHGETPSGWLCYTDPVLVWSCSLICTVLLLPRAGHRICTEFTKPQDLRCLNFSWPAWSFIFTCFICNSKFFLIRWSRAQQFFCFSFQWWLLFTHLSSLWISRQKWGPWKPTHGKRRSGLRPSEKHEHTQVHGTWWDPSQDPEQTCRCCC